MKILDGGIEREATEEEVAYINQSRLYNQLVAKKDRIAVLEQLLSESDYKIVKSQEYSLVGLSSPYDIETLHKERQDIRDEVNVLQAEVAEIEEKAGDNNDC